MTRIAAVTGATGGIGRWIALGLARQGFHTILIGRDAVRAQATQAWIAAQAPGAMTEIMLADLACLAATRDLAARIAATHPKLHLLVANAGIFRARRETTAEGHEAVLAVNHLSPFVLIDALQAPLIAAAPSRIVVVGSSTSDRARIDPDNLELTRGWGLVRAYAQSKLAVMITSFGWARRLQPHGVTVNVVHPGAVATGLVRTPGVIGLAWRLMAPFVRTEQQGADTPLYVATSPDVANLTGRYFKDRKAVAPNRRALDAVLAARVWDASVLACGGRIGAAEPAPANPQP
jgi:NAD(P)-dependent dehydrogenase (short-subunit alcohol dehydrogenase family)